MDQTSFGNTHAYYGDSTELLYLRARHYAPSMGRFLTRDTWGGSYNQPLTLNRWNYTEANPINWIDPTGHITENDNIQALIITEALRIDYNVRIAVDWGYMDWLPGIIYGIPAPNLNCDEWQYGNWRDLHELEWVRNGVQRLATKMGGPAKFKAAMKNRPVEIVRTKGLPWGFEENSGLAMPYIPLYFMAKGIMLPDIAFDYSGPFATYTTIHELGHVWDIRSNLSLSISMALQLRNTRYGNDFLFNCLLGPADPTLRFICALNNWQYNPAIEEAPGYKPDLYADNSLTEDWAEAVVNTVYPEYGDNKSNWRQIGPIRKIFVEMMMRDIH